MSKLLNKQVEELLASDVALSDDKHLAYVRHWMVNHGLSHDDAVLLLRLMRAVNPESFYRAWRAAQELNPELRWKNYDKRHAQEVEVRHEKIEEKHEPDVYRITEVVARKAEQADLFCS